MNDWQRTFLDFLRVVAAGLVLISHMAYAFLPALYASPLSLGTLGVYVFFLLSGFLIAFSVFSSIRQGRFVLSGYLCDRFARIYTAYLPALVLAAVIAFPVVQLAQAGATQADIIRAADHAGSLPWLGNLFMLQGNPVFKSMEVAGIAPQVAGQLLNPYGTAEPFWTISIEWWIYIVFGLLVFLLLRGKRPNILEVALLGFAALTPFYYLIGGIGQCLTALWIIGAGVAYLHSRAFFQSAFAQQLCRLGAVVFAVLMAGRLFYLALINGRPDVAEFQFAVFLSGFVFCALFSFSAKAKPPAFLSRFCSFVAGYSYSLYLIHMPVLFALLVFWPQAERGWSLFAFSMLAAHAVAIAFWALFERHYRKVSVWLKAGYARRCVARQA